MKQRHDDATVVVVHEELRALRHVATQTDFPYSEVMQKGALLLRHGVEPGLENFDACAMAGVEYVLAHSRRGEGATPKNTHKQPATIEQRSQWN